MPESMSGHGRSNSFQRMLELEKQYMFERLQASKPQPPNPLPPGHLASLSSSRSSIQARRAPKPAAGSRNPSPAERATPLVINTSATKARPEAPADRRRETPVKDGATPNRQRESPVKDEATPARQRETPVKDGATPNRQRESPVKDEATPARQRESPVKDEAAPARQRESPVEDEAAPARQREAPAMDAPPPAVATPVDKPGSKVVSFQFPPKEIDQRSICVSPSWEAHGRRKKEKKMEKREKDEAARNSEGRAKKGRLSKRPPPASSTEALKKVEAFVPDSTASRGRQKERLSSPRQEAAPRKPRSRSSSFASLIRSPFEFRRSSVDQPPEPQFIGGIKLEQERHLAHERALNEQAKADEANIHPALRDDGASSRWSAAPLKSPPPQGRDPNRRTYPPITRHAKSPKMRSLISPTAPSIPDLSTIDKWRARVGLRPTSLPPSPTVAQATRPEAVDVPGDASSRDKSGPPRSDTETETAVDTKAPGSVPSAQVAAEEAAAETDGRINKQRSGAALAPKDSDGENKEERDLTNDESVPSTCDSRSAPSNGYRTAPSTPPPPPPEPPRRSPRRNSLRSTDGSVPLPPLPSPTEATPALVSSMDSDPSVVRPKTPQKAVAASSDTASTTSLTPRAPGLSGTRLALTKPSREAVERPAPSQLPRPIGGPAGMPQTRPAVGAPSSVHLRHPPMSSSEDSCSEELHSPSPPSTPATSCPESEKSVPLLSNSDKGLSPDPLAVIKAARGGAETTDDEDTHDIQAAADKVLASFCQATVERAGGGRRSRAESAPAKHGFLPVPKHQLLRLRDTGPLPPSTVRALAPPGHQPWMPPASRDQSPRPAPATYLEEARRAAPAAAAARLSKQRLGPPASFVLPDVASSSVPSEASRSTDTIGRSLRPASTPSVGPLEREPLAKVFVECCGCRFFHDMPSSLYEAMANPEGVLGARDSLGYAGAISMTVKCPWCRHEMSTKCCAGLAAMVYVKERLH